MPMDKILLQKFLYEIARQCRFCLIAYEDINQALIQRFSDRLSNTDRLWYSVQSFLIASSNISKLLFGVKDRFYKQRAELRQSLGIKDSSPLKSRAIRNHFEHFDERLEGWFSSSENHIFVDSNIGPLRMFSGIDEHDFIRNLDHEKMAITFYGEECPMIPIIDAVKVLRERVKVEASRNNMFLPSDIFS